MPDKDFNTRVILTSGFIAHRYFIFDSHNQNRIQFSIDIYGQEQGFYFKTSRIYISFNS